MSGIWAIIIAIYGIACGLENIHALHWWLFLVFLHQDIYDIRRER